MSQFLRPNSNITQTSFTGGYAEIDESSASDGDFAYGANNTAAVLEVGTTDPSGTPGSGTCTVRYRIAKTNAGTVDGGGNAVTVTGAVYEGATQRAVDSARTATGTWTEYSFTFAASAVTDWTDVRLRFTTSASGGSPANRRGGAVSWGEIETPDAAVDGTATGATVTATSSPVVGSATADSAASGVIVTGTASALAGSLSADAQATGATVSASSSPVDGDPAVDTAGAIVTATASAIGGAAEGGGGTRVGRVLWVELEVPPSAGGSATANGAIVTASAAVVTGSATADSQTTAAIVTATAQNIAGIAQADYTASGSTVTATGSPVAGNAAADSVASGVTVTATASAIAGDASGTGDGSATGQTVTAAAAFIAGALEASAQAQAAIAIALASAIPGNAVGDATGVVLYLRCEGTEGSQTFIDSSPYGHTVTVTGPAHIDTTTYPARCGGGSILNGTATPTDVSHFDVSLGSLGLMDGDFTVEMWLYSGHNYCVFSTANALRLYTSQFADYDGLGSFLDLPTNYDPSEGWHHVAITRAGNTLRAFLDGVMQDSATYAGNVDLQTVYFGYYQPNGSLIWYGNFDEIRITKGIAHYTANFNPAPCLDGANVYEWLIRARRRGRR